MVAVRLQVAFLTPRVGFEKVASTREDLVDLVVAMTARVRPGKMDNSLQSEGYPLCIGHILRGYNIQGGAHTVSAFRSSHRRLEE